MKNAVRRGNGLALFAVTLIAGVASVSLGATRTFSPTVKNTDNKYYWNNAGNWTDENGNTGVPQSGDTVIITGNQTVWSVAAIPLEAFILRPSANIGLSGGGPSFPAGSRGFILEQPRTISYWLGLNPAAGVDVPIDICSGGDVSFTENYNGKGRMVKRGLGKMTIGTKERIANRYVWGGTVIEAGTFANSSYDMQLTNHELVFSGNDTSARYQLGSANQTFINVNFYESNGVDNVVHGFTSSGSKLIFTGDPVRKPTVFSGKFYDKMSFTWAPNMSTDEFVCSNAVSPMAGSLCVSNGVVRLVSGASFSNLDQLQVLRNGTFAVDAGAGDDTHVRQVVVDAGSRLVLGSNVNLMCDAAVARGAELLIGRYRAADVDWIEGEGMLTVGTPADSEATWTGNGGANTSVMEPQNWGEVGATELPEFELGSMKATFATGGTTATLGDGDKVKMSGLALTSTAPFTFAAADGAAPVTVGAEGIVADAKAATTTYTMNWPLKLGLEQTWRIGSNNTLDVNAPFSGQAARLTVAGPGRVNFNVPSELQGDVHLTNGTFYVNAGNACCGALNTLHLYLNKYTAYHFGTGTHDWSLFAHFADNNENYPSIHFDDNAQVTFNGAVTREGYVTMNVHEGATLTFKNGFSANQICKFVGTGHVIVTNKAMTIGDRLYMQDPGGITLDLFAPSNKINGNVGEQATGRMNTRVPYALVREHSGVSQRLNIKRSFILDLCGNDQEIGILGGDGGTIRSDAPALLHYVADWSITESQIPSHGTNKTVFAGCAGFSKEGTKVPYFLNATSSTTGTLQVVAGDLTMLPAASWPNATNVVVKGGTLHLTHGNAFGRQADVTVTDGKIDLPAGVVQKCHYFTIGGRLHRGGTWGSSSSSAANRDDAHFSGSGILLVYGEGIGTVITFR